MVRPSAQNFARWGTPPAPVSVRPEAERYLTEHVGEPRIRTTIPQLADIRPRRSKLKAADRRALQDVLGEAGVSVSDADRLLHALGSSLGDYLSARMDDVLPAPDAVLRPRDREAVAALLQLCAERSLSVVPFGGGTSVVGGLHRANGTTVAVAMDRMDEIISLDTVNNTVTVQPGVTGPQLERALGSRGMTLGHLPQSWARATIGGYAATRSAGQASTGYGRSDEMIERLVLTTPTGELTLGRTHRNAAGPDLRQLVIGSEGAFGIISEVTLRVRRIPRLSKYEGLMFPSFEKGAGAFRELVQQGVVADVMRLSDESETETTLMMSGPTGPLATVMDKYLELRKVQGGCLAILGWESQSRRALGGRRAAAWSVLRDYGAVRLGSGVGESWRKHRFDGPFLRDELLDRGYIVETLETATQWRQLARLKTAVERALRDALGDDDGRAHVMCHVSHVYETGASLYFTVAAVAKPDPEAQWMIAKKAACDAIMANEGTITHHHAVGADHAPWLADEIGEGGVEILRAVKALLDPAGVMNPGVLIPPR